MSPPNSNINVPSVAPAIARIRAVATSSTDLAERESLLNSAQKIEDADRNFRETMASIELSRRWSKANMDSIRKRDDLPWWKVVAFLVLFFAFLIYVAIKHHL